MNRKHFKNARLGVLLLALTVEGDETETEGVDMEPDVNVPDEGGVVAGGNE